MFHNILNFRFEEGDNSNKLDTLLEEKHSVNTSHSLSPNGNGGNSDYRRVYPEWKPLSTIEKSDSLKTTELPGMICKKIHFLVTNNDLIFFRCSNKSC